MYDHKKFDWDVREDADTIKRFREISSDPARLRKAKECLQDSIVTARKALGVAPTQPGRRSNPATITKLNVKY